MPTPPLALTISRFAFRAFDTVVLYPILFVCVLIGGFAWKLHEACLRNDP